jgi:hypothetical protein
VLVIPYRAGGADEVLHDHHQASQAKSREVETANHTLAPHRLHSLAPPSPTKPLMLGVFVSRRHCLMCAESCVVLYVQR